MKTKKVISFEFEKPAPNNASLEKTVLADLLFLQRVPAEVMDRLFADLFYHSDLKVIFEAIAALYHSEQGIDLMTVVMQLTKTGTLTEAGGSLAIAQLSGLVDSAVNIDTHILHLTELWARRQIIQNSFEAQEKAYDPTTDVIELVDEQTEKQNTLENQFLAPIEVKTEALADETLTEILKEPKGQIYNSCPVGLVKVDKVINHEAAGVMVIGARPAMGKTAFMLCAARAQAKQGIPVGIFSLEMTNGQLMRRLIAQEANVNLKAYDDDRRACKDVTRQTLALNEAAEVIKTLPLHFCEKTAITLGEILAQIKKWHTRKGIESVFVDYLQLVSGLEKIGNREQQVAIISRALKNIALRLKIRMTALSQLSRPAKGSEGRRPVLTDLRESGAIEQDAGIVLFLHRPAYYGITTNEDGTPVSESDCEVITAKNREGQMNVISNVKFNDKTGVFSDYDTNMREDSYERQTRSIQKRITPPEDEETPF